MINIISKIKQIHQKTIDHYDEDRREYFASRFIKGSGIEIGALHNPVKLNKGVKVKYVDYKSTRDNIKRYPELKDHPIVNTDIVDNGFFLKKIKDRSLDFITANHFLEHSPDPIGTINTMLKKLKKNGIIFAAVPLLDKNYDKGRKLTSLSHLIKDHEMFQDPKNNLDKIQKVTKQHLTEFIKISDGNIRIMNGLKPKFNNQRDAEIEANRILKEFKNNIEKLNNISEPRDKLIEEVLSVHIYKLNIIYDIHYHTFSAESYRDLFRYLEKISRGKLRLLDVGISGSGEVIAILRKNV